MHVVYRRFDPNLKYLNYSKAEDWRGVFNALVANSTNSRIDDLIVTWYLRPPAKPSLKGLKYVVWRDVSDLISKVSVPLPHKSMLAEAAIRNSAPLFDKSPPRSRASQVGTGIKVAQPVREQGPPVDDL
ncbi:hypothetical protein FRB99_008656, partial [Tulasnella sp. 403]